jgi:hypothetical protein
MASNGFIRSRAKSNGQMELHSFDKRKVMVSTDNTSEEHILQESEGITRTVKVSVDIA